MQKITVRHWLGNDNWAIYKIPQSTFRWDMLAIKILAYALLVALYGGLIFLTVAKLETNNWLSLK